MQRIIVRIVLTALFLLGCGAPSVLADGPGGPPLCYPIACVPN
jgi:hypothetical protein